MSVVASRSFVRLALAVFFLVAFSRAATPPVLTLSDGTNTVTVDSTGTVTLNCAPSSCVTINANAIAGQITWQGRVGAFTVSKVTGSTKPVLTPPQIDLSVTTVKNAFGTGPKTLTISWTDVGFDGVGAATMNEGTLLTPTGSTVVYTSYIDETNAPFGTETSVGSITANPSSTATNQSLQGPGPNTQPFSMTNTAAITLPAGASLSTFDYSLITSPPPPPLSLTCSYPSANGGMPYSSNLIANGGVPPYTFSVLPNMSALPPGLMLDSSSGVISGTPSASGTFSFTAQAVDSSGNAAINTVTQSCTISVAAPPVSLACPATTGQVGVAYDSFLVASDGVAPYTFSITGGSLPTGLTLNTNTGEITGTPTASGPFPFTAQVIDFSGGSANTTTQSCGVTITPAPTASCVAITAVQGVPIAPVTLIASGGAGGPYTFSATGLPTGLTMTSNGTISGTPGVSGAFPYTVTITDSAGHTGTINCSVTVQPPPSASCVSITAVQGNPITPVTLVGSGGVGGPYTFSATGLPAGLTISSSGTISGTPTVSGTFSYTVTIKDSAGNTGTLNCSITVNAAPSANCAAIIAVQGNAITPVTLVGSGGVGGPYTFSATGLPAGLTISSTGVISGTPTVSGTFSYTITVTDSAGNTGTVNCSVTVNPPPSATCATIVAVQGNAITPVTLTGSGGVGGPYTFSATGLPAGLTISGAGVISGTPTVSGTFSYTVTIKDSAGNVGTLNCSVTVNAAPSATCVTIVAVQGNAITPVTLVGTGGVGGPYTFSATGLPAGLTISSAGVISGTPTVSGTFSYTVTVKDNAGNVGTINCSVTVSSPPAPGLSITKTPSTTTPAPGQSVTYTYTVTNTGNITLTNVTVTDDNGTPNNPADDFTVGVIPSLAPGASAQLTATTIPSNTSVIATLGSAGPSGPPGLGSFAVLSLGGDSSHKTAGINCSLATVNGNLGIPSYGTFTNAGPCVENGNFYKGVNVTYSGSGTLKGTTVTNDTLMNMLRSEAFNASSYFAGLPSTPAVQAQIPSDGNIGSNLTVTGSPGINVVNLTGLTLTGNLTLTGPAGTQFVLNIDGNFNLHTGNITVSGGMGAFDVVYNITSSAASVQTMVPTTAVGILLAPYNAINSMDSSNFYGEIIGGYNKVITLMSGTRVVPPTPPPPTVTNTATASTTYANVTISATATATVTIE